MLRLAQEAAVRLPVRVLPHGPDSQLPPAGGLPADDHAAGLHDPLPQELRGFIEEDDVDPSAGGEVCEDGGGAGLQAPTVHLGPRGGEHGHVEVAVGPGRVARPGTEDHHDAEGQLVHRFLDPPRQLLGLHRGRS